MQKILFFFTSFLLVAQVCVATDAQANRGKLMISSDSVERVVVLFKEISRLAAAPSSTASATECGYIFPGDGGKFGCKGSGKAAADVAAACSGGGSLACTGSGSGRTCTCAFD